LDWRFDGLTALVCIAAGKAADLVVFAGNRTKNVDDVERVETVFKYGIGYDPAPVVGVLQVGAWLDSRQPRAERGPKPAEGGHRK
jgi:hypothetical protein